MFGRSFIPRAEDSRETQRDIDAFPLARRCWSPAGRVSQGRRSIARRSGPGPKSEEEDAASNETGAVGDDTRTAAPAGKEMDSRAKAEVQRITRSS
jgi:hypothetical protein